MGAVWLFDRDAKQWADWGFDYVKVDWNPNDVSTTKRIRKALDESGRDIVLSLSNAAPYEHVEELGKLANLWRTTGISRITGAASAASVFPGTLAEAYAPGTLE